MAQQPDADERWQEALTSLLASTLAILADDGTLTLHVAELAPSIQSAALVAEPRSKFQVLCHCNINNRGTILWLNAASSSSTNKYLATPLSPTITLISNPVNPPPFIQASLIDSLHQTLMDCPDHLPATVPLLIRLLPFSDLSGLCMLLADWLEDPVAQGGSDS